MDNHDTISKLNEALSKLITAYEKLEEENNVLHNQIEKLTLEKSSLIKEKEILEEDLSHYENSNKQQTNNINSMLGKIESLLGNDKKDQPSNQTAQQPSSSSSSVDEIAMKNIEDSLKEDVPAKNSSGSEESKLDLNRMASLLNGFGNK